MAWLFGQVWLYCLLSFLLGVVLTWLILRWRQQAEVSVTEERLTAAEAAAHHDDDDLPTGRHHVGRNGDAKPAAAATPVVTETPAATRAEEPVEEPAEESAEEPAEQPVAAEEPEEEEPAAEVAPEDEATEPTVDEPVEVKAEEPEAAAPITLVAAGAVLTGRSDSAPDEALDGAVAEGDVLVAVAAGPFGPGSAKALAGGASPSEEFTVKGNEGSMLFHTVESPYYKRTIAEVWFKTPADAEAAGFTGWKRKPRR